MRVYMYASYQGITENLYAIYSILKIYFLSVWMIFWHFRLLSTCGPNKEDRKRQILFIF